MKNAERKIHCKIYIMKNIIEKFTAKYTYDKKCNRKNSLRKNTHTEWYKKIWKIYCITQ